MFHFRKRRTPLPALTPIPIPTHITFDPRTPPPDQQCSGWVVIRLAQDMSSYECSVRGIDREGVVDALRSVLDSLKQ